MRKTFALVLALFLVPCLASVTAHAGPRGKPAKEKGAEHAEQSTAERVFSEVEKALIRGYFEEHPELGPPKQKSKGLPPGLAKRDQLPPGLAKRDQLPPGLAKRDIPPDLAHRLGIPPHGTQRVIIGSDVVLVETATGIVLDILRGVL